MPSPVGHALGAIAAGVPITGRSRRALWVLAAMGAAADLDLLVGAHRGISHSVGVALLAGLVTFALTRSPKWAAAGAAAWGSHVLLDWLGADSWPPLGIPALWPFNGAYYRSPIAIFPSVSRQYWLGGRFIYFNVVALAVELVLLLPLAWVVVRVTRPVSATR
ncbi:MAG TPA: metal-dependent hydrolase [Vicinamibacterales bacterium]|jgi:membrane-bound metal-dependent hydrolase YbcI (DUF457 family)|nr:metal-dependent hydrolase [Vicinamibacterales bacterium]